MIPTPSEARKVFFEAMQVGYASKTPPGRMQELPGAKIIPFRKGKWEVRDFWIPTGWSDYSIGMTVIYYGGEMVWNMSYEGWYSKEAIPLLKRAIGSNYRRKAFNGGRGPDRFTLGKRFYRNTVVESNFEYFWGKETIHRRDRSEDVLEGTHSYRGRWLLPPAPKGR